MLASRCCEPPLPRPRCAVAGGDGAGLEGEGREGREGREHRERRDRSKDKEREKESEEGKFFLLPSTFFFSSISFFQYILKL